jgi:hypothetical protein
VKCVATALHPAEEIREQRLLHLAVEELAFSVSTEEGFGLRGLEMPPGEVEACRVRVGVSSALSRVGPAHRRTAEGVTHLLARLRRVSPPSEGAALGPGQPPRSVPGNKLR